MNKQRGYTSTELAGAIFLIVILAVSLTGWVMNITKIVETCCQVIDGLLVMRIIGIFIAPLGAVMGYL